jgi:hypothetical protein
MIMEVDAVGTAGPVTQGKWSESLRVRKVFWGGRAGAAPGFGRLSGLDQARSRPGGWARSGVLVVGGAQKVQHLVVYIGHTAQRDLVSGLARSFGLLQAPGGGRVGEAQAQVHAIL